MELFEDPTLRKKYELCKKTVKLWESQFKKTYNRIPSKHDIREANSEIRDAYKTYFYLKTSALEESLMGIPDFDIEHSNTDNVIDENKANDSIEKIENEIPTKESKNEPIIQEKDCTNEQTAVWGEHLNNDVKKDTPKESKLDKSNRSITQKLFVGTKFSKRNPRKSISFTKQKSKVDISDTLSKSQSQPEYETNFFEESALHTDNLKIVTVESEKPAQAINITQQIIENSNQKLRSVNKEWVDRTAEFSGIMVEKSEEVSLSHTETNSYGLTNIELFQGISKYDPKNCSDSDDIIANSDSDDNHSKSIGHITKKRRTLTNSSASLTSFSLTGFSSPIIPENTPEITNIQQITPVEIITKVSTKIATEKRKILTRKSKRKANIKTQQLFSDSDDEADPFAGSDSDIDPDFQLNDKENKLERVITSEISEKNASKAKIKNKDKFPSKDKALNCFPEIKKKLTKNKKIKSPKTNPKIDIDIFDEEKIGPTNYMELSRSELPTTVPRFQTNQSKYITKLNQELKKSTVSKRTESSEDKLEKKVASGSVNDNFVRINLQKKVYVRGKKTMNFSKYKKQQWRANKKAKALAGPEMDMGGCDGGFLTCFKCGQMGHFARQCKVEKENELLPLEAVDNVSPFPTLEEASQMAQKSKLAIHTNKLPSQTTEENISSFETNVDDDLELSQLMDVIEKSSNTQHPVPQELLKQFDVKPVYETNLDGSLIETPIEIFETLKIFGHSEFRPGQEQAIMRILSGLSTVVTMSTGSGKSLCYQLPAYLYNKHRSPSIALVISPLISLMEDQVAKSKRLACLHTAMTETAKKKALEALQSGNLDALLISPEAVVAGLDYLLRRLPPISFACIDEVHCVSQWSYNFRPSYLSLCRVLRERLGVKILLGLTATAPVSIQRNILEHLQIKDKGLIGSAPVPDNLTLTVSKDPNKDAALVAMLKSERFHDFKSVVVYCTRREECERLAALLRTYFKGNETIGSKRKRVNWYAEPYHAGLSASRRRTIQNAFMSGELRIVVATVAFGMGINKADIRAVIHYNIPKNFESYVQEVGRAGRDGLPAFCHLFLSLEGKDLNELKRHIYADSIDRHVIRKLLKRVFIQCECKSRQIDCPKHEVGFSIEETVQLLDIPEENIATLLCYLELHEKSFIQVLSPAYTTCKVVSYNGVKALKQAAQTCPPLAMAIALEKQRGTKLDNLNVIEFPVIDIASAIGWESGMVKHSLKNLEWIKVNGQPKRSSLTVSLSNLGFRIRAAGDLSSNDLDMALDFLYERVVKQERLAIMQLQKMHATFENIASVTFKVSNEEATNMSSKLKGVMVNYFAEENIDDVGTVKKEEIVNEGQIASDVRSFLVMYRDNNFTGRTVARIFHGIGSPNYPPVIWGRCKYWRMHLSTDFNSICKIATNEILRMR